MADNFINNFTYALSSDSPLSREGRHIEKHNEDGHLEFEGGDGGHFEFEGRQMDLDVAASGGYGGYCPQGSLFSFNSNCPNTQFYQLVTGDRRILSFNL